MATINTRQAGASMRITRFGGIDRRAPSGLQKGACTVHDMDNLRLRTDGTLERRCGFAPALTLPAQVRGVWSGSFAGVETTFAVAGETLYRLDFAAGTSEEIGAVAAGEGKVALFLYRGKLLCLDGTNIHVYDGSTLTTVTPYVPLVSDNRTPYATAEIHEPINLIGREARFSFRGDGEDSIFYFGYTIDSISSLYNETNGRYYLDNEYSLHTDYYGVSWLRFTSVVPAGNTVVAHVTLHAKYLDYAGIAACTEATVYGGAYDDRIFCWGGADPSKMYCSMPVTQKQIDRASYVVKNCGDLYFPLDSSFCVGDGRYPVRAVCRHYDRLLVFTDGDTWMADFTSSNAAQFPVLPINSGVGCTADGAAALAGNDPLTVADGGIWRWRTSTLRRDECSAESVSDGLAELFGAQFSTGALAHSCRGRNEVWFADPTDGTGRVYVYHVGLGAWYRFSGITADGFFSLDGDVAFWRGSSFYRFDEARETDLDEDGEREITAQLVLDGLDFDGGERHAHLTRLAMRLRGLFPALELVLETDLGRVRTLSFAAGGTAGETLLDRPAQSGRFRALRLTLTATGETRLRLCGLTLTAEPGKRNE